MYGLTGASQLNEAGINYYSLAVSSVNRALNRIDWNRDDFNDALLLAVILLYIHGVSFQSASVPIMMLVSKRSID